MNEIKAVLLNPGVLLDALEQAVCDNYVTEIDQLIESLYIYLNKWRSHSETLRLNVYQVSFTLGGVDDQHVLFRRNKLSIYSHCFSHGMKSASYWVFQE